MGKFAGITNIEQDSAATGTLFLLVVDQSRCLVPKTMCLFFCVNSVWSKRPKKEMIQFVIAFLLVAFCWPHSIFHILMVFLFFVSVSC